LEEKQKNEIEITARANLAHGIRARRVFRASANGNPGTANRRTSGSDQSARTDQSSGTHFGARGNHCARRDQSAGTDQGTGSDQAPGSDGGTHRNFAAARCDCRRERGSHQCLAPL